MRIAIVGLGTAGACMLDSLVRVLGHEIDVKLTLYDPTEEPWVGRVFRPDGDWVLANVPVSAMSLRYGDTAHAVRWLVRNGWFEPGDTGEKFLPRGLYGRYISQHSRHLVWEMRRRGWQIEFVKERATSLQRNGTSGFTVGTQGRRDEHDYVILCAGGSVLSDPFGLDPSEGYIADPYPTLERLAGIPSDAAIGILGSGLTAVDVAVALQAHGHTGPVRLYSRSGVLPLVRRPGPQWTARHLTPDRISALSAATGGLRLRDLEELFDHEVRAWGGEPRGLFPRLPVKEPQSWLRWQLEHPHEPRDLGTFIFQKSVPTIWGDIWYALRPADKQRLLASSTLRNIMSRCCPMPRVNAEKVLAMLESGQVSVTGGVETVLPTTGGLDVHLRSTKEHVDYVINAVTPAGYGVHPDVQALVDRAIDDGLARGHDCGGVEVAGATGAVPDSHGPGGVYALGDLTRGAFFFIFGLPALVRRSADIAAAIQTDTRQSKARTVIVHAPQHVHPGPIAPPPHGRPALIAGE